MSVLTVKKIINISKFEYDYVFFFLFECITHLFKGKVTMLSVTLCRAILMISFIYFSIVVDFHEDVMSTAFFIVIKLRISKKLLFVLILHTDTNAKDFVGVTRTCVMCLIGVNQKQQINASQ